MFKKWIKSRTKALKRLSKVEQDINKILKNNDKLISSLIKQ